FDWEQLVKARTIDRPLTCVLTRNCTSRDVPDTYGPGHRTPRAAASRTPSGSGGHRERRAMPLELGNAGPALHDQLGEEPARERAELEAVARADRPHHHVRMAWERADHEPLVGCVRVEAGLGVKHVAHRDRELSCKKLPHAGDRARIGAWPRLGIVVARAHAVERGLDPRPAERRQ